MVLSHLSSLLGPLPSVDTAPPPLARWPHPAPSLTAHLLSIGDELLIGQVVNTNAAWLGQRLGDVGVSVVACEAIRDDIDAIGDALRRAIDAGADAAILTGGLGPTHDDLTVEAIAAALERPLRFDAGAFAAAAEKIRARGRDVTERHRRLGMVPEGFQALPNPRGLAPGLWGEVGKTAVVAMPGVPYEMTAISEAYLLPRLRERSGDSAVLHHTFQTVGEGETALAARIGDVAALAAGHPGAELTLAYLPAMGTVRVRLSARGPAPAARAALDSAVERVRLAIGSSLFGEGEATLEAVVGERLVEAGFGIGIAESCTGGAVLARLTSVAGASRYVLGGIVAYDNSVKQGLLGVSPEVLREHGAVSEAVALAMAAGARRVLGAEVGLATTGVAGPGGGSPEKPVGTVWLAIDMPAGSRAVLHRLTTDRQTNIALASMLALDLVRRTMNTGA